MDSFLEEPRTIPQPAPIIQEFEVPTVPEVSLMFQNTRKEKPAPIQLGKSGQSYNAWKLSKSSQPPEMDSFLITDKENISTDKSFLSKKQVRFESPVSNYALGKMKKLSPEQVFNYKPPRTSPKLQTLPTPEPPKTTKLFEKLYISNIPSRDKDLDLSFLEYHPRQCGSAKTQQSNDCYTNHNMSDVLSFRTYSPLNEPYNTISHKLNRTAPEISQKSPKPTYKSPTVSNTILTEQEMAKKIQQIKDKKLLESKNQNESVIIVTQTEQINAIQKENNVQKDTTENTEQLNISQKENSNNCETQKEYKIKQDDPISVNELLTIIKLQNEQLQTLQKTVDKLVKITEKQQTVQKTNEPEKTIDNQQQLETSEQQTVEHRDQQVSTTTIDDQPQNKISVGLMTSFEVRQVCVKPQTTTMRKKKKIIQPQQPVDNETTTSTSVYYQQKPNKKHVKKHERFLQHQKYLQSEPYYKQQQQRQNFGNFERDQNWRKETNETEYSLGSGEDLEVQEPPESPENSIHIDMQEYDTESEESDDECTTDEGWTFYKDILGQVNHLLENSPEPTYNPRKDLKTTNHYNELNIEQIKQDTIKRLQSEGFLQRNANMNPTEVSFAVKQILMKYMPDEGLSNVHKNKYEDDRTPTDMSIAAFKYTQQYNLVAPNCYARKPRKPRSKDPKILDITTLKQQPKYL